jgi:predicted acetyltransferase
MPARSFATPPKSQAELETFIRILVESLGFPPYDPVWVDRYDHADIRLARRKREVAAGLWLLRFGQWFGGRSVPMVGIHAVGVAPEHRGKKVGSALMRAVVEEMHHEGVPISTLFPATQPIYRGAGYAHAGSWLHYRYRLADMQFRDRGLEVERVTGGWERLHAVYAERARRTNGNLDRNAWAWQRTFHPILTEPDTFAVHGGDGIGGIEGYVTMLRKRHDGPRYDLIVRDLVALTPAAARRILALLSDHRSMGRNVIWTGAPGEPLGTLLREQNDRFGDDGFVHWLLRWMVRLVDVRKALTARGYPPGLRGKLDLDVRDDMLPANAGRITLQIEGGKAKVGKGGRGTFRVDVRGLAALYTSYLTPYDLRITDLLDCSDDAALATAAAIFAGPAPWLSEIF